MDIQAGVIEHSRKGLGAVVANDGCMVSHAPSFSTFCANGKHILSLDFALGDSHHWRMNLGARIKNAREARGWSQVDLAEAIGKAQTTVSSWERGRTEPTREDVQRIADELRLVVSDLEGISGGEPRQNRSREVPLISWVSAGQVSDIGQIPPTKGKYAERILVNDLPDGDYFATDVRGDSMDRVSPEGSRIIVNVRDRDPRPGKLYLFSLRGEATYKRYQAEPVIRLEPFSTNPMNQTIYPKSDRDWHVIGRVVRSYIDLG